MTVDAIQGFPYMMQLVGYYVWEMASAHTGITLRDVDSAIGHAMAEMADQVFEETYAELSDVDLGFLCAMLADDGPSRMADIAPRMNKSYSYAAQYRKRLLEGDFRRARSRKSGVRTPVFQGVPRESRSSGRVRGAHCTGVPCQKRGRRVGMASIEFNYSDDQHHQAEALVAAIELFRVRDPA